MADNAFSERPDTAILDNVRSERVKKIAALSGRSARNKTGLYRVEGPHGVLSLLEKQPSSLRELFITQQEAARRPELISLARAAGQRPVIVTDEVLRAMVRDQRAQGADRGAQNPQGVLAVAVQRVFPLSALLAGDDPLRIAVFHEIRDPGNAGTVLRAADASGADAVVFTAGSVDPFAPKVVRSTVGSLFHLPLVTGIEIDEVISSCRAAGVTLAAASGYAEESLYHAQLPQRLAWVFGNEAHGLPDGVMAACEKRIAIPITGSAESLNLAMAATLCLFEAQRRSLP
ncbi:RNA methyltransferase [Dermabacteraceae bacterium TAE3-ERU5]|nr:RNA methyltransferase [Dermabacteraceae bacterium TAE3-ERU5]